MRPMRPMRPMQGNVATSGTLAQLRPQKSTTWILPWQSPKGMKNVTPSLKPAMRHTCRSARCVPSVRLWRGTGNRGNIRKRPFARSGSLSNFKMATGLFASKWSGAKYPHVAPSNWFWICWIVYSSTMEHMRWRYHVFDEYWYDGFWWVKWLTLEAWLTTNLLVRCDG